MPGGAGSPIEGKQKAFVPPPAGRAGRDSRKSFRGKSCVSPRRFCVTGADHSTPPRNASPAFGRLRRPPAALRAARGRGLPRFCRLHHVGPLRPVPGTVRNPAPRGCDSLRYHNSTIARHACGNFRLPTRAGAAQSFSTMQSARVTRNKKQSLSATQTSRFNLPASDFNGVSATVRVRREKRLSPPLPQKAGAEGWGIPLGRVLPPRRANLFRLLFRSLGKVAPAERNKQLSIAKNQK